MQSSAVEPCVFMRILLWHLPPIRVMMKTKHIPSQPWLCLAATYEELKASPQNQVHSGPTLQPQDLKDLVPKSHFHSPASIHAPNCKSCFELWWDADVYCLISESISIFSELWGVEKFKSMDPGIFTTIENSTVIWDKLVWLWLSRLCYEIFNVDTENER